MATMQQWLETMGCDTEKVLSMCPRGFVNEWGVLPIPAEFAADAQKLVDSADEYNLGAAEYLTLDEISKTARISLLQWTDHLHDLQPGTKMPKMLWSSWCELAY